MKAQVDTAVYERVIADYAARRRALEAQAAPLVTRALAEYRKLRAAPRRRAARRTTPRSSTRTRSSSATPSARSTTRREARGWSGRERILAESAAELATLDAQDARFREALPDVDLTARPGRALEHAERDARAWSSPGRTPRSWTVWPQRSCPHDVQPGTTQPTPTAS